MPVAIITDNRHRAHLLRHEIRQRSGGGFRITGWFTALYLRSNGKHRKEDLQVSGGGATVHAAYNSMIANAMSRLDGEPVRD